MSKWKKYLLGSWSWKRPFYSLLTVYLLLFIVVLFFANPLIFHPPKTSYSEKDAHYLALESSDDEHVSCFYYPAKGENPTIIWSHGNAEDIGQLRTILKEINRTGLGVIAYDYPGYGVSSGKPSEQGCYNNITAVWKHLTDDLNIPKEKIIILGQSIGTGLSTWLAKEKRPAGLILISPLKSANRVVFSINPFPYDRFENIHHIKKVKCPLLVMHGDQDKVISFSHGEAIAKAHTGDSEFITLTGLGHNDIYLKKADYVLKKIEGFAKNKALHDQ